MANRSGYAGMFLLNCGVTVGLVAHTHAFSMVTSLFPAGGE